MPPIEPGPGGDKQMKDTDKNHPGSMVPTHFHAQQATPNRYAFGY